MKKFDQEKIIELKQSFDTYDKDNDGILNVTDMQAYLNELGFDLNEDEVIDIINEVDYDGSGTIEFEEFLIIMQRQDKNQVEGQIREIFKEFDTDNNGMLSIYELQKGLQKLGDKNIDLQEIEELLNSANINSEGEINYEDFLQLWKQNEQFIFITEYFKLFIMCCIFKIL